MSGPAPSYIRTFAASMDSKPLLRTATNSSNYLSQQQKQHKAGTLHISAVLMERDL